jgi:hypothetical protein
MTSKLGLFGAGPSGSLTALTSVIREPYLFDVAAVHVSFLV